MRNWANTETVFDPAGCITKLSCAAALVATSRAAWGASSGAIGFSVLQAANNQIPPGFTLQNAVTSNAIGGAIWSPISGLTLGGVGYCLSRCFEGCNSDDEKIEASIFYAPRLITLAVILTPINIIFGLADSLIGAQILNMLPLPPDNTVTVTVTQNSQITIQQQSGDITTPQNNFAALVGVTGGALTVLGPLALLILLRIAYLLMMSCHKNLEYHVRPVADLKTKTMLHLFRPSQISLDDSGSLQSETKSNDLDEHEQVNQPKLDMA